MNQPASDANPQAAPTAPHSLSREALRQRSVSGREVVLRDGEAIVSMTDTRGVITYVNDYFTEISGYSESELIGQPHNVIRHPHMPPAAFADLWRNLKAGRPWVGMVQNRCKNGDHYWVQANVTPIVDGAGQVSGYMSVRQKVSAERIAQAEREYAALRDGTLRDAAIRNGELRRPTLAERIDPLRRLDLGARLWVLLLTTTAAGGLGTYCALQLRADTLSTGLALGGLGAVLLLLLLARASIADLLARLRGALQALRDMATEDFQRPIDVDRDDLPGRLLQGTKSLQIRLGFQMEQARRDASTAQRINQALDVAATNIMVADHQLRIVYLNKAVLETFRAVETTIARSIPGFRADDLLGSSIDRFHAHPAHQRGLLAAMRAPHSARIGLSGLTFDLVATPVTGRHGEHLGYVVEWRNRTDELRIEQEIEDVVQAAVHGRIDRRISEQGKQGHSLQVTRGINAVLDSVHAAVDAIQVELHALARGDLSQHVERHLEGVFGEMAFNANETVDHLAEIVGRIQQSAVTIHTAASEIAAGNADLALRTEQQAASLEETASSMEQLTATVQHNADNAHEARQRSVDASAVAEHSGDVVTGAVDTMAKIARDSRKIEDIIAVIDSIAFQTNILALNAAVEAARAGEQGRGFAVVASEVRALAQRSATSAREIKQLIASSSQSVSQGSAQVNQAGTAISGLVGDVDKVSELMTRISSATDEQAAGIQVVNQTVTQLDQATQQNAALVEQASAAARALEEQAAELAKAIQAFKLAG